MPPQDPNTSPIDSHTDDLASMLGFITTLSQGMMQHTNNQNESMVAQQQAQATSQAPQELRGDPQVEKMEKNVMGEIEALKKEVKGSDVRSQVEEIEKELKEILAKDGTEGKS